MPKGFVYILECSDDSFYTGSTLDIEKRVQEHQDGKGANHTKKRLPVSLVFCQEFQRIDDAFYREKQIQGWSRKKKEALIKSDYNSLMKFSGCKNETHSKNFDVYNVTSTPLSHQNQITNSKQPNAVAERSRSYSNGKLLLTGEYLVLDGALSLALPTKYGQSLEVYPNESDVVNWKSFDEKDTIWFEKQFNLNPNEMLKQDFDKLNLTVQHEHVSKRLIGILNAAKQLNPDFLNSGFNVASKLTFPRNWGLGSSSTLINNIATWAQINPYKLLKLTFGGSGYDIACAQHDKPITYQLPSRPSEILNQVQDDNNRIIQTVDFNPSFKDCLYFVYLNKKQNSRDAIQAYRENSAELSEAITTINEITKKIITCKTLFEFDTLITEHELIIGNIINQKPIKQRLFSDFNGCVKSLGAWGGDFVLVTSKENPSTYFKDKGFDTIILYSDMVKN